MVSRGINVAAILEVAFDPNINKYIYIYILLIALTPEAYPKHQKTYLLALLKESHDPPSRDFPILIKEYSLAVYNVYMVL